MSINMVKQQRTAKQSEFTMSNEDFPALPGTQNSDVTRNAGGLHENNLNGTEKTMTSIAGGLGSGSGGDNSSSNGSGVVDGGNGLGAVVSVWSSVSVGGSVSGSDNGGVEHQNDNSSNDKLLESGGGVQTSPDAISMDLDKITNIPAGMVDNQFGMVGLLTFLRAAESDPSIATLALGTDLTGLGLNLNSRKSLHPTFAGPFADQPCRAQDVEHTVPQEYMINFAIRDKLNTSILQKLPHDLPPIFTGPFI